MTCSVCADERCLIHCVWCGVDCETPSPLHHVACPHATGVYPAQADECCCTCGEPVQVYVLHYEADMNVGFVTCLACDVTRC